MNTTPNPMFRSADDLIETSRAHRINAKQAEIRGDLVTATRELAKATAAFDAYVAIRYGIDETNETEGI